METTIDVVVEMARRGVLRVNSDGEVWKCRSVRWPERHMTPRRVETKAKNGYLLVKVCWAGKQFMVSAHRLVWTVLVGPIPEGMEVNHKDGDKRNNALANLELVTRSENALHSFRQLGQRTRLAPVVAKLAPQAKELRAQGLSYAEIAKRMGVAQTTAFRAVHAK